ncbi:hypothetical protein EV424DRAFT_1270947, partial [Suillus variegatus]
RWDWTRELNNYTRRERERLQTNEKSEGDLPAFIQVMSDGPYRVDLGLHESVFLIAGGSGVILHGVLCDIIGKCVKLGCSQG